MTKSYKATVDMTTGKATVTEQEFVELYTSNLLRIRNKLRTLDPKDPEYKFNKAITDIDNLLQQHILIRRRENSRSDIES
jgi:hypothetical protein